MPTKYEAALLSDHIYDPENNPLPPNWECIYLTPEMSSTESVGYAAAILINCHKNEAVISHRGSKFSAFPDGTLNLRDDLTILSGTLPSIAETVLQLSEELMQKIPSDMSCTQVGHSLGGFHAHMIAYATKTPAITFDPLACLQLMETKFGKPLDPTQTDKHHSYFIELNAINSLNTHVGHQYVNNSGARSLIRRGIGTAEDAAKLHTSGVPTAAAIPLAAAKGIAEHAIETHQLKEFIRLLAEESEGEIKISNFREVERTDTGNQETNSTTTAAPHTLFVAAAPAESEEPHTEEQGRSFKSKMFKDHEINDLSWVVSIVNAADRLFGHNVLVVEGIDDNNQFFVSAYDIKARAKPLPENASMKHRFFNYWNPKGEVHKIRCFEGDTFEPGHYQFYITSPHLSYQLNKESVKEVIRSIKADVQQTLAAERGEGTFIPYQLLGSKGGPLQALLSSGEGVNCAEYLINKFKAQGIDIGTIPIPKKVAGDHCGFMANTFGSSR